MFVLQVIFYQTFITFSNSETTFLYNRGILLPFNRPITWWHFLKHRPLRFNSRPTFLMNCNWFKKWSSAQQWSYLVIRLITQVQWLENNVWLSSFRHDSLALLILFVFSSLILQPPGRIECIKQDGSYASVVLDTQNCEEMITSIRDRDDLWCPLFNTYYSACTFHSLILAHLTPINFLIDWCHMNGLYIIRHDCVNMWFCHLTSTL